MADASAGLNRRLAGRSGDIWRRFIAGETQAAIADTFGISPSRVGQIIREVRDSIGEVDRRDLILRELEHLDALRVKAWEIINAPGAPVTAGKDGLVVHDPEVTDASGTPAVVRDHSGRIAAMRVAIELENRLAKLLGLDAPAKVQADVTVHGERELSSALAAEALADLDEPLTAESYYRHDVLLGTSST